MNIYTRRGDTGDTDLYGSGRIDKDDSRIQVIGTVDELNALIGEVLSVGIEENLTKELTEIQKDLFVLGADLATIGAKSHRGKHDVPRISDERVSALERIIDELEEFLRPMTAFILPGGCVGGAKLHVARTVCRRAERDCVTLSRKTEASPVLLKYLNRLSDLLFVMARYENAKKGGAEVEWKPN